MKIVVRDLAILINALFATFSAGAQFQKGNGDAAGWALLAALWIVILYCAIRSADTAGADHGK